MVPEELLGTFEHHLSDAAVESRYTRRADKSQRPFGGYNVLNFGDFFLSPSIGASVSLCLADNSEVPNERFLNSVRRGIFRVLPERHDT